MNRFDRVADFWIEYVCFGGFTGAMALMEIVEKHAGAYASLIALVLFLPVLIVLVMAGMMVTAVLLAALILTSPIAVPVAIYMHRKELP